MPIYLKRLTETAVCPTRSSAGAAGLDLYTDEVSRGDYSMSAPPPRASGTIPVKLEYMGRGKPLPADDPWQD